MDKKYVELQIVDEGIPRLITWPDDGTEVVPAEAIRIDVYDRLHPLFADAGKEYWQTFVQALWDRGLIRAQDFRQPLAHKKIRQALNAALKRDVLSIVQILQE